MEVGFASGNPYHNNHFLRSLWLRIVYFSHRGGFSVPSESFTSMSGFWNGDSEMEIEPWREWPRNHLHQAVALI